MTKNYFSLDEDYNEIIKRALYDKNILSMNQITTGWTNIVYEVNTDGGNYFFRFPRDDFWGRTIVKDYEFAKFISGKTEFETVKLELLYDEDRPFSMHKKIEGNVLADKIEILTSEELVKVANDIAKFMFQLHNVEYNSSKIFDTNNIGLKLVDFLDELLNVHVSPKDKEFWDYNEFIQKDNNCLVHGDLNLSNILLNENNNVTAIIDFGFAGYGNKYYDISRVLSRDCPNNFKDAIIKGYEGLSNNKLQYDVLETEIDIWKKIDGAYINYMRTIGIYE